MVPIPRRTGGPSITTGGCLVSTSNGNSGCAERWDAVVSVVVRMKASQYHPPALPS